MVTNQELQIYKLIETAGFFLTYATICRQNLSHKYFYAQTKDFGRHTANMEMMTNLERKCLEKENDNTEHTPAEYAKCMVAPAIVYIGHERVI